ncbi:hypothetical protein [Microbacterium sp. No. 7]|uniref:hypothetical protein n=1 Tax=Microbacterium sp. No. 7 TaxID=1714373 RepID=UPI000AC3DF02|nr:hypothetical protein [Microbacterium sp. No. 7]
MLDAVSSSPWPAHTIERREWRQRVRGGSREGRMLRHVDVWIPPLIASLDAEIDPASLSRVEEAVVEISRTDAGGHPPSSALARFLLRGESVASSKIERISASTEDYARALGGSRANASASSMVAASAALHRLVDGAMRTAP